MLVPIDDPAMRELYITGTYEAELEDFLESVLREGDVAVDVGANIGVHTLLMAALVGNTGRVYAFEPNSIAADSLAQSLTAQGWGQRVVLERLALSDSSGIAELACSPGVGAMSSLLGGQWAPDSSMSTVATIALDDYWTNVERPRVMKIDVEGWEANVIAGASRFLRDVSPDFLIIEISSMSPPALLPDLTALGYSSVALSAGTLVEVPVRLPSVTDARPGSPGFVVLNVILASAATLRTPK